jgi:hypothetical protein
MFDMFLENLYKQLKNYFQNIIIISKIWFQMWQKEFKIFLKFGEFFSPKS